MMDDRTCVDRQFELLKEVRDICEGNGIKYFLYGQTALEAYRNGIFPDTASVSSAVCIPASEVMRFIDAVNEGGRDDRAVDSMLVNERYPAFDITYCDEDTIDFNFANFKSRKYNCIGIRIQLIGYVPSSKLRKGGVNAIYEAYKKRNADVLCTKSRRLSYPARVMDMCRRLIGDKKFARAAFDSRMKMYSRKSGNVNIGGVKFPSELFDSKKIVKVRGEDFAIPEDHETFFSRQFGGGWLWRRLNTYSDGSGKIRDAGHSWREFKFIADDVDLDRYYELKNSAKGEAARYSRENGAVQQYYRILARTHDRFTLFQKYRGRKVYLQSLYDEGKCRELWEELRPYFEALAEYESRNLGLCFDREIMDLALKMLEDRGWKGYAGRLRRLVPAAHLKAIEIVDPSGKAVNDGE